MFFKHFLNKILHAFKFNKKFIESIFIRKFYFLKKSDFRNIISIDDRSCVTVSMRKEQIYAKKWMIHI